MQFFPPSSVRRFDKGKFCRKFAPFCRVLLRKSGHSVLTCCATAPPPTLPGSLPVCPYLCWGGGLFLPLLSSTRLVCYRKSLMIFVCLKPRCERDGVCGCWWPADVTGQRCGGQLLPRPLSPCTSVFTPRAQRTLLQRPHCRFGLSPSLQLPPNVPHRSFTRGRHNGDRHRESRVAGDPPANCSVSAATESSTAS